MAIKHSGTTTKTRYPAPCQAEKRRSIVMKAVALLPRKSTIALGNLISRTTSSYDPTTNIQKVVQGDIVTTTFMNSQGLPIKVQQGDITISYQYDALGDCVASTDGEGKTTRQKYDKFNRLVEKTLPDSTVLKYDYDLDSNMVACWLPNDTVWKASYDTMGRKCSEERRAGNKSSERWEYIYQNGYLVEKKDPMQRIHSYQYDSHGRVTYDSIGDWQRIYSYDERGLLASVEQQKKNTPSSTSRIDRTYDQFGRIETESVYLNSNLVQYTEQSWTPSTRTLKAGNHRRDFTYQNGQLTRVTTDGVDLTYIYALDGSLQQKITPLSTTTLRYNTSALPTKITTDHIDGTREQMLSWTNSGKIASFTTEEQQKEYTYSLRGYLQNENSDVYEFDFGKLGAGVLTNAPQWSIPQDGLDLFGKVIGEVIEETAITTVYDAMGQVISHNNLMYEWNPWGQLVKVSGNAYTWEATYDGLGRRIQTFYTPKKGTTLTTTSLYDPQTEFQEIGIKYGEKTFWKIFGQSTCEAIVDDTGASAYLSYNVMGHLTEVIATTGAHRTTQEIGPYGPAETAPLAKHTLMSVAQSMCWHSKSQDPTGLIWMGARYYDPQGGRFISPDPIGYPINIDLYAYAGGDPINNYDPDGRFASSVYQTVKSSSFNPSILCGFAGQAANRCFNDPEVTFCDSFENIFSERSFRYDLSDSGARPLPPGMGIGFVNGMLNFSLDSRKNAEYLSELSGDYNISCVYNATHGTGVDFIECLMGYNYIATAPVRMLHSQWDDFFANNGNDAYFLQKVHSQGALHTRNALYSYNHERRSRIFVVAIAPAAYIPKEICGDVVHYRAESSRDPITIPGVTGLTSARGTIITLKSSPDAPLHDHAFTSPTFRDRLEKHITTYIESGGKSF